MRNSTTFTARVAALLLGALLIGCAASPRDNGAHVFIVRHAEKAAGSDPELSIAGQQRAETLGNLLADEGITRIFTTDTRRTRATVAPLARRLGILPETYDHRRQAQLVERVRDAGETVLIVGHSNTIGSLAASFGVDRGEPVAEASEYDRLYVITIENGNTRGEIRRYGD